MKTAVLISGQMRTFARCYATQKWQIFRHYEPDIHFFISVQADPQAQWMILERDYGANVHWEVYEDPTDLPKIHIDKGFHAPYANATTHDKLMLQHWGNQKVWQFFEKSADKEAFETVIRIRPDQWIRRFIPPRRPDDNEVFCPWWGKFGGINDRLAIMGLEAARNYFNVYSDINDLLKAGCPFHPESLLAGSLEMHGMIARSQLLAECSTERTDGTTRWAEIVMSDIAELKASR